MSNTFCESIDILLEKQEKIEKAKTDLTLAKYDFDKEMISRNPQKELEDILLDYFKQFIPNLIGINGSMRFTPKNKVVNLSSILIS